MIKENIYKKICVQAGLDFQPAKIHHYKYQQKGRDGQTFLQVC